MFELRKNLDTEECTIQINSGLQEIHKVYHEKLDEKFKIDLSNSSSDTYYTDQVDSYYNKVNSVEINRKKLNKNLDFYSLIELNIGLTKTP